MARVKKEQIIFPGYYRDFKCRASACSNNCCIGWEIDIDGETLQKYRSMPGELGEKIRTNIRTEREITYFLMKNGRCPFLGEDNLCEIISTVGDGGLCHICREHPRFYNELSGVTLGGVGMSCEAAAELILGQDKPELYGDISRLLDWNDEDFEISSHLCRGLLCAENILRSEELSDGEKLSRLLSAIKNTENKIEGAIFGADIGDCEKAFLPPSADIFSDKENQRGEEWEPSAIAAVKGLLPTLEFMSNKLPEKISKAKWSRARRLWTDSADYRRVLLNCLGYLATRYIPKADGDFSPSSFIFSSFVILSLLISDGWCLNWGKECSDRGKEQPSCDKEPFACGEKSLDRAKEQSGCDKEPLTCGEKSLACGKEQVNCGKARIGCCEGACLSDKIFSDAVRAAVLYSEEIEYSEENVLALGQKDADFFDK